MNVTGNDEEFESGDSTYGYLVAKRKLILLGEYTKAGLAR